MNLTEHLPLARAVAGRYARQWRSTVSADDIHQVALMGLWEAIQKHDGVCQFAPYATMVMRLRIIDELRLQAKGKRRTGYVHPSRFESIGPGSDVDVPALERDPGRRLDAMAAMSAPLDERQRAICSAYLEGERQLDIAARHGITSARVSQIFRQSVEVMREHLGVAA